MRILLLVFNQIEHGTYWRAFHLARILAARQHQVTLLAVSPSAYLRFRTRTVHGLHLVETPEAVPRWGRFGWDPWDTLLRCLWLRGRIFDIVHAFEARPVVIWPALRAQRQGAKLVMDWADWFGRGGSVEERANPLLRTILRPIETYFEEHFRTSADGTTVINSFLRERALGLGVRADTILLLRNGSQPGSPPPPASLCRQRLGLPAASPLIGYSGQIFWRDAQLMAQAFNQLQAMLPGARLLLAGRFNRPIESLLTHPAAIIRTGPLTPEQLHLHLAACDICWLPLCDSGANRGRWPMKLNDYMTAGRPVVATAVGDLDEVISAHHLGITAPPRASDLAAHTVALWQQPEQRELMGQAARHAAETVFSWETLGSQLEAFYHHLLARDARPESA